MKSLLISAILGLSTFALGSGYYTISDPVIMSESTHTDNAYIRVPGVWYSHSAVYGADASISQNVSGIMEDTQSAEAVIQWTVTYHHTSGPNQFPLPKTVVFHMKDHVSASGMLQGFGSGAHGSINSAASIWNIEAAGEDGDPEYYVTAYSDGSNDDTDQTDLSGTTTSFTSAGGGTYTATVTEHLDCLATAHGEFDVSGGHAEAGSSCQMEIAPKTVGGQSV